MRRESTRISAWWERRTFIAALLGVLVLSAVSAATASGGGANARSTSQVGVQSTIQKIATVNVADLPAALAGGGGPVALPQLHFDPAAFAAAKASGAGSAVLGDQGVGAKPKLKPSTQLPSALSSTDDPRLTPPDMGFAVGGGYKMEQINASGRIWDPSNTAGPVFTLSSFYNSGTHFIGDPWVTFDQASGRWFAAIFDIDGSSERLAVSTSSAPTTFNLYNIPEGAPGGCPDQGKLGVSDNVVAISANEFSSCFGSPSFLGVIVTVLNKSELVAGAMTIHKATFGPLAYSSSVVPAQSMNSTTVQWYAGLNDSASAVVHVVKTVGTPPATVTLSEPFTPAITTVTSPPDGQQPGGGFVATGDNRVQTVGWQSNLLVFTAGAGCIPAGDSTTRACARLIAVNTMTGAVTIDKTHAIKGQYLFYPAVRQNAAGTSIVGYGRSSSSIFPQLDAIAADTAGTFSKAKVLQTGDNSNQTGRYGDYFAVGIDPANPSNGWVAGEIGGHNNKGTSGWATAIRSVLVKP
jgi:hypothetical protein